MDDFHGGDVFWTLAVHDLTIIKHIAGSIPSIKYAKKICSTDGFSFALIAVFDGHVSALMQINGHHSNKRSGVSIHGRLGSAELFDAYDDHIILKTQKEIKRIPIDTTFPLYLELKEFINYLSGGSRPRCDLFSAKEVTQVILQLIDSADERSIV